MSGGDRGKLHSMAFSKKAVATQLWPITVVRECLEWLSLPLSLSFFFFFREIGIFI